MSRLLLPFVCSTSADLKKERALLLTTIQAISCLDNLLQPPSGYNDIFKKGVDSRIAKCNLALIVVGNRYGQILKGTYRSRTEYEYNRAYHHRIPCLIYIKKERPQLDSVNGRNRNKNLERLLKFKAALMSEHTATFFESAQELSARVSSDLLLISKAVEEARLFLKEIPFSFRKQSSSFFARLRVFLSYARADEEIVDCFAAELRKYYPYIWLDKQQLVRWRFDYQLVEVLSSVGNYAIFLSNASLQSEWVRNELNLIINRRIRRQDVLSIPILLEDVDIPPMLLDFPCIDLRSGEIRHAAKYLNDIIRYRR